MERLFAVLANRWLRRIGGAVLILALLAELVVLARPSLITKTAMKASPSAAAAPLGATTSTTAEPLAAATPAPTTTTAPSAGDMTPTKVTSGTVAYNVPAGQTVTIKAVHSCWIEARKSAGGSVQVGKILAPGESKDLTTPVLIRFGDPTSATATLDGRALQLPTAVGGQLVLTAS